MANRLGVGEYESVNVEVKQSTIKSRHIFLQTLNQRKEHLMFELLSLFNSDRLPEEFLNKVEIESIIYIFLQYLLEKNPHKIEIRTEIIDTPLINYYWYFFGKEDEIKRLEDDEELQQFVKPHDRITRKSNAIRKIIPSWKELKTRKDAEALCQSLENWAKEYNLNEDWFLDFALGILRKFKCSFDFELAKFKEENSSLRPIQLYWLNYQRKVRDSIRSTITNYWLSEVWLIKWVEIDDLVKLPAFEYRWRNFELHPMTWLPQRELRQEFAQKAREKLDEEIEHFNYLFMYWHYSDDGQLNDLLGLCQRDLENYCNHIKQLESENVSESDFQPIDFEGIGKAVWFPSKQDRKEFVENTLTELKIRIEKTNKAAQSLKTFTKRHFETALTKYCNDIEKYLPKELGKTPMKYSENKHFEWLVDYQIPCYKSYTEIAKENSVDLKTVREAVQKLAKKVGISLREAKHTGRTKGAKDSPNSNRQLGLYKK